MNRLIYEGRLLVNIAGSMIRQDDLRPLHGRLDWERMYRTADYHKIANIVYLGMLGSTERGSQKWQERFFERYLESLRFNDVCRYSEKEVLVLLDLMQVPCIILTSCGIRDLYLLPETAGNSPLRLYIASGSYVLAKGFLVDLGYETERVYAGFGERMKGASGFSVDLYYHLPFRTRTYQAQAGRILERAYIRNSYQFIRTLSLEDRFIFRVAEAVYHYVTDELLIRELMDIHLYYVLWSDKMNGEYIRRRLTDFKIDELGKKLIQLARMWFGTKADAAFAAPSDDMGVYDILENRILSNGQLRQENDSQALFIARQLLREENRVQWQKRLEQAKERLRVFGQTCLNRLHRIRQSLFNLRAFR